MILWEFVSPIEWWVSLISWKCPYAKISKTISNVIEVSEQYIQTVLIY